MKTLTVTLKQHTPLIHFQPGQYGATLRASEVKPKLDRFILGKLGKEEFEEAKRKKWLIGKGDHPALNYKMRIIPFEKKEVKLRVKKSDDGNFETQQFPMLLSNMGGKKNEEELANLNLYNHVVMTLMIKDEGLYGLLRKMIPHFFAVTNFGQRSTKGFGSFTVFRFDKEKAIEWDEELFYEKGCPVMFFKVSESSNLSSQKIIFDAIDFYWKCLKAGINYTKGDDNSKFYIKSYLYYYLNNMHQPKLTWEKREIKSHLKVGKRRNVTPNSNRPIFARALLGCPDKYLYNGKEIKVEQLLVDKIDNNKIARIPSPIYLKPVCIGDIVYIYILFNSKIIESLKGISERTFRISYGSKYLDLNIEVFLDKDNYKDFILGYHEYLSTNEDVLDALYCQKPIGEYKTCKDESLDEVYGFVPRNFKWKNILGKEQAVGFYEV